MYQLRHFDMGRDRITVSLVSSNFQRQKQKIPKIQIKPVVIDSSESKEDEIAFF